MKPKKFVLSLAVLIFVCSLHLRAQSVYGESVHDIDSNNVDLQGYTNKKILFIVIPLSANDSLAMQVKSFAQAHQNIQVIGVLSIEDGYTSSQKASVKNLYSGTSIVLTEGLNVRKGSNQSPVMQWLTTKTKNNHFDKDATGIGCMFFVSASGKLYSVLTTRVSLNSPVINKIISSNPI